MRIYKNIIVGSGPVGCHIFRKLSKNSILITGKTKKYIKSRNVHPKIKLKLKKFTNKFTDLIFSKKNNFYLYSPTEIGGFSNYWGKQFFNYNEYDNWPKSIFKKYSIYKKNLDEIDNFYFSPKHKEVKNVKNKEFEFKQIKPPILKNQLITKNIITKNYKKQILEDRVIAFKKIDKNLIMVKTEKKNLYCRNLILSAGPIGNAFILMRSFKKINYLTFKDDNPRMIFGFKFNTKNSLNSGNENLIDLDIFRNKKLKSFCIIYDVNPSHFNIFFKKLIYFFKKTLTKFFFYGQFWVKNEFNEIKLKNGSSIKLFAKTKNSNNSNIKIIKKINTIGLKVIAIINLRFAFGFHYHCLKVNYKGKLLSFNQFINKKKLSNNLYCFDSSVIDQIGLKPPTKTYLATANHLLEKYKLKLK